jgi:hypothetical protein
MGAIVRDRWRAARGANYSPRRADGRLQWALRLSGRPELYQDIPRGMIINKLIINMILEMNGQACPYGVPHFGIELDNIVELRSIIELISVYWNSGWQAA